MQIFTLQHSIETKYRKQHFMNDQKLENLLNLALDATDAEREKSLNMNFGYDRQNRIWELIVRYHGDLSGVGEQDKRDYPVIRRLCDHYGRRERD